MNGLPVEEAELFEIEAEDEEEESLGISKQRS